MSIHMSIHMLSIHVYAWCRGPFAFASQHSSPECHPTKHIDAMSICVRIYLHAQAAHSYAQVHNMPMLTSIHMSVRMVAESRLHFAQSQCLPTTTSQTRFVFVHTHVYTHVYVHVHTYVHTHAYTHVHTHVYTHAYTHVYTHAYTHVYTHVY